MPCPYSNVIFNHSKSSKGERAYKNAPHKENFQNRIRFHFFKKKSPKIHRETGDFEKNGFKCFLPLVMTMVTVISSKMRPLRTKLKGNIF